MSNRTCLLCQKSEYEHFGLGKVLYCSDEDGDDRMFEVEIEEENEQDKMTIELIETGDPVVYIPGSLTEGKIKEENLGIVTSKNDTYVFVRYKDKTGSQATRPDDLYTLKNRPDLIEKLGIEVKPYNRICEIYLNEKRLEKEAYEKRNSIL